MQQFKPYYTGQANAERDIHASLERPIGGNAVVSIQPCVRTSDIEEVGDATHLTLFEMLGNFSFQGAYFKEEAIAYAWQFITEEMEISPERLAVTIFKGDKEADIPEDEESRQVWKEIGVPEDRIFACDRADNFWGPTGKEGPCGPTVEIHYDLYPDRKGQPNDDSGRYLEIWNVVFNEYYMDQEGLFTPLTAKGVDTGMGLERLALVLFDTPDVFGTPLFDQQILWMLDYSTKAPKESRGAVRHQGVGRALLAAEEAGHESFARSVRVIADHMRAAVMLASAGVRPSNTERGYILRRLIRRAKLHAHLLELAPEWPEALLDRVLEVYREAYASLLAPREELLAVFMDEITKFEKTLERGLREFEKEATAHSENATPFTGEEVFRLFETYGFPIELSTELAASRGVDVDAGDLERVRDAHREKSRAGQERKFGGHGLILDTGELKAATEEEVQKVTREHTATHMLQAALRHVLGASVQQAGSDITAERLRFDFTFERKITEKELQRVEDLVNQKIQEDLPMQREEMPFTQAKEQGALAFARGTYPETVNVYSIPGFSKEVCGGPHVTHTAEVGKFRIVK
jgi:alanyl-tRNA synthetase